MSRATITITEAGYAHIRFPYSREGVHEELRESLKGAIPRHSRGFNPELKYWWVDPDYVDLAKSIVGRYFPGYVVFEDRPAVHTPPPPPPPRPPTPIDPYAALHLLPSAPLEVVEAVGRAMAKLHHPDLKLAGEKADATAAMARINGALDRIRRLRGVA